MAFRISTRSRNAACNGFVQGVDQGSANATARVLIYTGSQPADPQTSATGTLLATIYLNNPSFAAAASGSSNMVLVPPLYGSVVASGTAGWFRLVDRDGNAICDGSVGLSGADMNFDDTSFIQGGIASLTGFTITVPQ